MVHYSIQQQHLLPLVQLFCLPMHNVTVLEMQSVQLEQHVFEAMHCMQNVVQLVHQHGPVKQMSLEQLNNVEV